MSACQDKAHSILPIHVTGNENTGIELGVKEFEILVESGQGFAIEFYSPYCGHCEELAPKLEKYMASTRNLIYRMDMSVFETSEEYQAFAEKHRNIIVDDYVPAIRFVSGGELTYDVSSNKFDSYTALNNILNKHVLSSHINIVSSKTSFDEFLKMRDTYLAFSYDLTDAVSINYAAKNIITQQMVNKDIPILLLDSKDIKEDYESIKSFYHSEDDAFISLVKNGNVEKTADYRTDGFDIYSFIA